MSEIESHFAKLLSLPALEQWDTNPISVLEYEIGIWGKLAGTPEDYGLIAKTRSFPLENSDYYKRFYIGNADQIKGSPTFMWKPSGKTISLASISRSDRKDASNRTSLQTVILTSNVSVKIIPAPIQALILLPLLQEMQQSQTVLNDLVGETEQIDDYGQLLNILPSKHRDIMLTPETVVHAFKTGLAYIQKEYKSDQLYNLYSVLLEGGIPASLANQYQYPAEIVGVLLSFLDPAKANSFSVVENLPSSSSISNKIEKNWSVILQQTPECTEKKPQISENIEGEASALTQAIIDFKLSDAIEIETSIEKTNIGNNKIVENKGDEFNFTLWGPTSSGKTVFLSQLFWEGTRSEPDWEIQLLSTESMRYMKNMHTNIQNNNKFPVGNVAGHEDSIEFLIINNVDGVEAKLLMQDRAGIHYSGEEESDGSLKIEDEILDLLEQSTGLIFLFDPSRERSVQVNEVWTTLQTLQLKLSEGYEKIHIPVAVCLTKADYHINTLDDLHFARTDPDAFVRTYAEAKLIEQLEKYCSNYSLFPVSAVGLKVSEHQVKPIVFYDDDLESRVIPDDDTQTVNLMSPFIWLIDNIRS